MAPIFSSIGRLLRQALLAEYRGRFYNAQDLMDELYASLADASSTNT